ncbi:hypothetical protein KVR801_650008 [Klebsiella variicola]|nr:hypothetical protein KVR801_650008 [Klebsiella variicola]
MFNCFSDIHRITAESVKFGDNQYVTAFHSIKQPDEPWSFAGSNRTTYMFLNQTLGSDGKTRRFNFMALIFCILFQSGDPTVGKNS